ncbi:MAG TPA: hypothetical protein VHJ20_03105 [Polyangia bacterium]|nr:hypothetical protein [Polyangia bacterium]
MRALVLVAMVFAALALGGARGAHAYPQWQFSSGTSRCDQCHFAPAGGGLINSYGRDAAGEDLATFGGNGAFLHGATTLPAWLALGGDLRGALVSEDDGDIDGTQTAVFPMQADAEARLSFGLVSVYGVAGLRGQERDSAEPIPLQNYQPVDTSRFVSREHWIMLRASPLGGYVRAGRFFAPFGLRMAEHILYVRRDLGLGTLEESYNLSSGYVGETWEAHATAFAPDFVRHMGSREGGASVYVERRFADVAAAALQARFAIGPGMTRTIFGGVGKYWVEPLRTLFLAEADFVRRDIDTVPSSYQLVAMGGFSVLPAKGVLLTVLQEREQVDLAVRGTTYDATTGLLSWFPYAHVEIQAMGRVQVPSGSPTDKTFFLQLHYFL